VTAKKQVDEFTRSSVQATRHYRPSQHCFQGTLARLERQTDMPKKQIPVPHIPLPFETAVKEFLKVKPPKKQDSGKTRKTVKQSRSSK
jgi:hypothetical protein